MKTDVIIIGSSVSGNLIAAYLRKYIPELNIMIIDKGQNSLPIVGESLTEFSTHLLHEIGLAAYLEEEHFHKYGLTFYFKEKLSEPEDRRYSMHEALACPPLPSNQINRFALDAELRRRNSEAGVSYLSGSADPKSIEESNGFTLRVKDSSGKSHELQSRWLIDASGRGRVLAKRFDLHQQAPYQRSSFWFRLTDYDPKILKNITAIKPPQQAFDSHYVTHHFFGKANWIWCIPMRTREQENMISIGIVWRPDLYEGDVRNLEEFNEQISREHPVVTDLVASGTVIDTNLYRNYMYEASQVYSPSGWFLLGDSGDTVDPLYSTGLVMTSLQITQIAEMICQQQKGNCIEELAADFQTAYKSVRGVLQNEISTLYEVMHDPYQSHWRMHLASLLYFFSMLPSWLCGYMSSQNGARYLTQTTGQGRGRLKSLVALLPVAAEKLGPLPAEEITNKYDISVNWELWRGEEKKLPRYLSTMLFRLARFRFQILRDANWHNWKEHLPICLSDLFRGMMMRTVFRKQSLKELIGGSPMKKGDMAMGEQADPEPIKKAANW